MRVGLFPFSTTCRLAYGRGGYYTQPGGRPQPHWMFDVFLDKNLLFCIEAQDAPLIRGKKFPPCLRRFRR